MIPAGELDARPRLSRAIQQTLGRSLHIRHLDSGSCNGCDWEIAALMNPYHDVQRLGIDFVASPRHADLLLVTGPRRSGRRIRSKTSPAISGPCTRSRARSSC